jgi:hypothetical protein
MKMNFRQLSTKDLAAMCQRTFTVSSEAAFTTVTNNPLLTALQTVYNEYDAVYVKKTFSGKSELLASADKKRDTLFGGLKDILLGHSKLSISSYNQTAKDVYAIIELHDIALDRFSYAEETAQLKKLLEELALPGNAAKVEQMQLTGIVTELKTAQAEFENLFNQAAGENSELRLMESATSMRQQLEAALRDYLNLVKAMSSQPVWKELYAKLSEVAKAVYNSRAAAKAEESQK